MKTLRFLILGLLATVAIICRAQITEPGWYDASSFVNPLPGNGGNFVSAQEGDLVQGQTVEASFPQGTTAIAEAITPEIQSLALGLENDPLRIFNYVHDHIRHVLYFGSKKGAQLTLLERSGNDFDQCALLVALLSAAGYSNNVGYQFGMLQMPYDNPDHNDLHHWLGLDLVNTNWLTTSNYFSTLLAGRGYPLFYCIDNNNTMAFPRVWVTLNINGTTNYLDPAFKISEPVSGIDLPAAMGLDTNALMTAAGGTSTADYVKNLNESALRSKLQSFNTNLLLTLQNNYPNFSVKQILGGREILPWTNALSQALMYATFTDNGKVPVQTWTYQPTEFMSMIQITWVSSYFGTVGKGWYYPQLQGMRLSLTCSNAGWPIFKIGLWEGDSCHLLVSTLNSSFPLTVTITHPYGGWDTNKNIPVDTGYFDSCVTNTYQANNAYYAFIYAFELDQVWLRQRQQQLDIYRQQGYADTSREVITETLNVMGLNWMIQTEMSMGLLAQQGHTLHQFHDRFGRMAQESGRGYYIDAYLQLSGESPSSGAGAADFSRRNQVISVGSYIASAQEHAVIEQLQCSNLVAASTVKMLQIANTNGQAVYLANSNNWTAGAYVRNQLVNYDLSAFDSLISKGYSLLLPTNGAIPVAGTGSWTGQGFIKQLAGPSYALTVGMIISGGYSGGYVSASTAIPNPSFVAWFNQANPFYVNTYPSFTHVTLAGDPVNMADASFRVNATDLSVGAKEPLGMTVSRSYTPTRRHLNQANLANGWMHNYCFNLDEVSAPEASLGGTTPAQMAPMLVATCAALNFYQLQPDPKNWMVTALTAKWGIDQTISNAVSIMLGNDTIQFVKQPDGSFTPPANCTMTLTKGSTCALQERHGNTFNFNSSKQLTSIVDPSTNTLNLTYTSGLLTQVSDWKNRTLAFTYSGTPSHLDKITDNSSPTRSVSFGYSTNTDGKLDLVSVTDPEGKTSTYGYDANHQITATSNALNQLVVSNLYDGFGHVTTQYTQGDTNKTWRIYWSGWQTVAQDPAGGKHRYFYDDKTRQIGEQDELGNLSQTFYDGQDHVVMTISPLNETNRFIYDGNNNLIYSIDPLGFTNQFIYDTNNNLIKTIDPLKNPSTFGYNAQFSLTGATNGAGDWVNYSYTTSGSLAGTLASRTDSGGTTTYGYDSTYGQLNSITNPGSLGVEHFVINSQGDMTSHTDARGFSTTFQYNLRRQLTNCIAPTNLTVKLAYDAVGNLQTVTDARTNTTSITWSATRHWLSMTLPSTLLGAPVITNAYDNRDWLTRTVDPLQNPTFYTNDLAGRLISLTDPVKRTTTFGYDADGRNLTIVNAANETNSRTWDARGDLLKLTDGAGHFSLYTNDAAGNLIILTNRNGKKWQFLFDGANRLTSTITPLGRSNLLVFNHQGLVASLKDQAGQPTSIYYDAKGRLTNRTDYVGTTLYGYDANDNMTSVTNVGQASGLSLSYDAYNRVSTFTNAAGYVIQYRYDGNGNLTSLIYPGNRPVTYLYDSLNRMTNVTDWSGRKTTIIYDLAGHVTNVTRPNGTYRTIAYDAAGQVTNIWEQMPNSLPIAWFRLNWTNSGNMAWEFAAPLPHTNTSPMRNMTYDDDNQLWKFQGPSMGSYRAVDVDPDGNLTSGPLTNDTFVTYTYNARNRLLSAGGLSYGYDAMNNRIAVTNGANVARFVINPNSKLPQALMRIRNGVTNYYVYGVGLLYEVTETATTTNTLTYHYDYRGSTVALTDGTGTNVTDRIEYSVYATTTYRTGTNDTPFLFNGRYGVVTDPNGLLYMRARYYNPYLCRFLNADPIGFAGGLNFYAFANGNPVSYLDPFGLDGVGAGDSYTSLGNFSVNNITATAPPPVFNYNYTSQALDLSAIRPIDLSSLPQATVVVPTATIGPIPQDPNTYDATILGSGATPGTPLAQQLARTTAAWYLSSMVPGPEGFVVEETQVYRVWGGKSGPWSESWTTVNPNTVPNFRSAAGLPDVNAGRFVSEGVLQSTEGVTVRSSLVIKPGQQGNLPELLIKNAEQKIKLKRVSGANPEF